MSFTNFKIEDTRATIIGQDGQIESNGSAIFNLTTFNGLTIGYDPVGNRYCLRGANQSGVKWHHITPKNGLLLGYLKELSPVEKHHLKLDLSIYNRNKIKLFNNDKAADNEQ